MLPGQNGLDILKKIRKEGIQTPIILLTSRSLPADKITGLDQGADDYITKPFDTGELLARIRARTRTDNNSGIHTLILGNIWLDQTTQRLGNSSNSIKLGHKEYQLMEHLMRNSRQILPKDMLITKVWGFDEETEYNNLEVYISFLRKKLRFLDADINIKTTKNVGYSLEEVRLDG